MKSNLSESYDGGNEFNHLEQAIFAADELNGALSSLVDMNEAKFSKYGDIIKKIRRLCNELPPMLETLKKEIKDKHDNNGEDFDFGDEDDEEDDEEDEDEDSQSDDDDDESWPDDDQADENGEGAPLEDEDEDDFEDMGECVKPNRRGRPINEEFGIKQTDGASSFEDQTWQCEDFWEKLHSQGLESAMDEYFEENYPEGMDLTEFNDLLRFNGDDVLAAIGYDGAAGDETEGEDYSEGGDEYNNHIGYNRLR